MKSGLLAGGWVSVMIAAATGCASGAGFPLGPDAEVRHEGGTGLDDVCKHASTPAERASACLTLAGYVDEGRFGLARDRDRATLLRATAVDTLEASCDLGAVEDCTRAAIAIGASLGAGGESAESVMWMERYAADGCSGGDAAGCAFLGAMYESGRLVARDPARATAYHDQACSGGERRSCLRLAERARGKDARRAYERACDAGSGFGCAAAGLRHREGFVDQVVYFARGCALGDPASCLLGVEAHQRGGSSDRRGAASFAWTGCQHGIPDACLRLGEVYERGDGISRNARAALEAYRKACDGGLPEGCDALRAAQGRSLPRRVIAVDAPASTGPD